MTRARSIRAAAALAALLVAACLVPRALAGNVVFNTPPAQDDPRRRQRLSIPADVALASANRSSSICRATSRMCWSPIRRSPTPSCARRAALSSSAARSARPTCISSMPKASRSPASISQSRATSTASAKPSIRCCRTADITVQRHRRRHHPVRQRIEPAGGAAGPGYRRWTARPRQQGCAVR